MYLVREPGDMESFLFNATKREAGSLVGPPRGKHINLGCGRTEVPDADNLDLPEWEAPELPYPDGSVAAVHMYHFLEHLSSEDALRMLIECEQALMPGGVVYIAVPHASHELAYQALDHRTFYTEETFQDLFNNKLYDPAFGHRWRLKISYLAVAGVAVRNLCVLCQLVKT